MSENKSPTFKPFPESIFEDELPPHSVESGQQSFTAGTKLADEAPLPPATGDNPPPDDVIALWLMVERAEYGVTDGEASAGFDFYGKTIYLHNFRSRLSELRKEFASPEYNIREIFDYENENTIRGRGYMRRHFLTEMGRRKALAWLRVRFNHHYGYE